MPMKIKIVFFGSSEFSARILEALHKIYEIPLVITQPDKPVGRKKILQSTPVAVLADRLKIPLIKPGSLRKQPEVFTKIQDAAPDLFVVVAYGKIIPDELLQIPKKGPINIHGSILPKYRGAAPIQGALAAGASETGITIMLMDAEMDHGPVLSTANLAIGPDETFEQLESRLATLAEQLILKTIPEFLSGKITPIEQNHSQATFTKIISREDGAIDWKKTAAEIYNQYRAFHAWPGIWTIWQNQTLKINKCRVEASQPADKKIAAPGEVLTFDGRLLVQTGQGLLEIEELQLEGKNRAVAREFLNGHRSLIGSILG